MLSGHRGRAVPLPWGAYQPLGRGGVPVGIRSAGRWSTRRIACRERSSCRRTPPVARPDHRAGAPPARDRAGSGARKLHSPPATRKMTTPVRTRPIRPHPSWARTPPQSRRRLNPPLIPAPALTPILAPSPRPALTPALAPIPRPALAPALTPIPRPALTPAQAPIPRPALAPAQATKRTRRPTVRPSPSRRQRAPTRGHGRHPPVRPPRRAPATRPAPPPARVRRAAAPPAVAPPPAVPPAARTTPAAQVAAVPAARRPVARRVAVLAVAAGGRTGPVAVPSSRSRPAGRGE